MNTLIKNKLNIYINDEAQTQVDGGVAPSSKKKVTQIGNVRVLQSNKINS